MFRNLRREKQKIDSIECVEILKNEARGVLAVSGVEGYPYAVPMNFVYLDGKPYFHCSKAGHRSEAIDRNNRVSFCVFGDGYSVEGDKALHFKSVIVFGRMRKLTDELEIKNLMHSFGAKYGMVADEIEDDINKTFKRLQVMELTIDNMTGKNVREA